MTRNRGNLREHRWGLKITTVLAGLLFLLAMTAMAAALPVDSLNSDVITEASPSLAGKWINKTDTDDNKSGGVGEAVVGTGDYIYIARCYTTGYCNFWQYNPNIDAWWDKKAPHQRFKNGVALAWDGEDYIYALLGASYGDTKRLFFYRYNIPSDTWEPLNNTTHPQGAGDALTWCGYDKRIYAMMGKSTDNHGGIHYGYLARYDPYNDAWKNLTFNQNWTCTDDGASLVWTGGEYLYALQGEVGEYKDKPDEPITNFSRYNISNGTWEDMCHIPESEGIGDGGSLLWIGNRLSEYEDYIFALGGGSGIKGEAPGNKSYIYCISRDEWKEWEQIPCPVGEWVGNRLGFANGHIYYWQGAPSTWDCGGKAFYMFEFEISFPIFDTGPGTYPSIFGTHNGTITPNQTMKVSKLYTYPCVGTGGHTEYARIWNSTLEETARWDGYKGDWHNISFNETFTLVANETYNYTIKTGSYPQIRHTPALPTANGWINCTEFRDANGKIYYGGIPAIKLYF